MSRPEPPDYANEQIFQIAVQGSLRDVAKWAYDTWAKDLLNFADSIVKSMPDAQDIVGNAFVKLLIKLPQIRSANHARRLIFVIVRHDCISYLRSKRRNKVVFGDPPESDMALEGRVEAEMIRQQIVMDVREQIEKLPAQRRMVIMYYLENKKTDEIAVLMNISQQTVLNHKSAALRYLREANKQNKELWDSLD